MLLIDNPGYTTEYFSLKEKRFLDASHNVSIALLTPASFAAHSRNETLIPVHLNEYQPVLPDIYPIPPRTKWSYDRGTFTKLKKNIRLSDAVTFDTCLKNSHRLLKTAKGKIAIEISGGLDSSIVIGTLERLGFETILIGTISPIYKFRTERHIQEIIGKKHKTVIWCESFARQFADLLETPDHFLPNFASLQHSVGTSTLTSIKEHGVRYVLQGTAFDSMLVDAVGGNPDEMRWPTLQDNWLHDYTFAPHGMSYVDVAALSPIKQMLLSLRLGQGQDLQKWWARTFFADLIPRELSQYAYKANFGPQWWDGLLESQEQIEYIVETAWKVTSIPEFKHFSIQRLFDDMNHGRGRAGFSLLSYANWVHALQRAGRLDVQ